MIRDGSELRVVPADRKVDNGSSDDAVTVDLSRARYLADPAGCGRTPTRRPAGIAA